MVRLVFWWFLDRFPTFLPFFLSFEEESLGRIRFLKGNYPQTCIKARFGVEESRVMLNIWETTAKTSGIVLENNQSVPTNQQVT